MAGLIGSMAVQISANTNKFKGQMKGAAASVNGFSSSVHSATAALWGFMGPAAIIAAGVALIAMGKKTMSAVDAQSKMARTLGVSTEALVGLHHAANLNGASAEDVTGAVGRMSRMLGEAANGSDAAKKAFSDIGLDPDEMMGKSPDEAFAAVADAIGAMGNKSQQAAAASAIFGRSYAKLLPMFEGGAAGLKAARAEAEALGMTFSADLGKGVEDANDSIARMWEAIKGGFMQVVVRVAPIIQVFTDALTKAFVGVRITITRVWDGLFGNSLFDTVKGWATGLLDIITAAAKSWGNALIAFDMGGGIRRILAFIQNGMTGVGMAADLAAAGIRGVAAIMLKMASESITMFTKMRDLSVKYGLVQTDLSKKQNELTLETDAYYKIREQLKNQGLGSEEIDERMAPAVKRIAELRKEVADMEAEPSTLTAWAESLNKSAEEAADKAKPSKIIDKWMKKVIDPEEAAKKGSLFGKGFYDGLKIQIQEAWAAIGVGGKAAGKEAGESLADGIGAGIEKVRQLATPAALARGSAGAYSVGVQSQADALSKMRQEQKAAAEKAAKQRDVQIAEQRRANDIFGGAAIAGAM